MASKRIRIAIMGLISLVILVGCGGGAKTSQSSTPSGQGAQAQTTQVTLESPQVGTSTTPLPVKAKAATISGACPSRIGMPSASSLLALATNSQGGVYLQGSSKKIRCFSCRALAQSRAEWYKRNRNEMA